MQRWRDRHCTRRRSRVMRIGIIGAGQIGGTLTRRLAALGHDVRVSNSRTPDTLAELEAETGAKAVRSTEAAEGAELVIVSIPQKNVVDLPAGILSGAVAGAPVIETNNYYPQQRDGLISAIEDGQTESGWVQEHLGVPVFKAFNGIWWKHLLEKGLPEGAEGRIALPVAGDDDANKQVVFDLINQLGFDPVDAGTIDDSWRQQPGTPVYGKDFDREATLKALAEASPDRTDEWRATTTA
ncbi:NADPH-dependent F420 reductase [Rhodococcus erythropolis]|uniref:NADPH-dependent F420 reductase n=1 Tax=Rhodococcus TaxID=1827 RepID=UPI00141FC2F6|nr:NAD(P)-binding domain-containing protein [uncultured Rhodococcus sp.]NHP16898.1 NAD(P)-binding domain-containing protein [Rhodococcus sp. IC4_135]